MKCTLRAVWLCLAVVVVFPDDSIDRSAGDSKLCTYTRSRRLYYREGIFSRTYYTVQYSKDVKTCEAGCCDTDCCVTTSQLMIALIVVGVLVAVYVAAGLAYWFKLKKDKARNRTATIVTVGTPMSMPMMGPQPMYSMQRAYPMQPPPASPPQPPQPGYYGSPAPGYAPPPGNPTAPLQPPQPGYYGSPSPGYAHPPGNPAAPPVF